MEFTAGLLFAAALVLFSYGFNRWLIGDRLKTDVYRIALTASAVLLLAILAETLVNPLYELLFGAKLWVYRVFPLHNGNVSALAPIVWTAYGIHLHFTLQTMDHRLPIRMRNGYGKAFIVGLEAPFFAEVTGNLLFLVLAGQYYAYYLPSGVGHLTSFQVVPIYMVCIFIGLIILRALEKLPRRAELPSLLFLAGTGYLLAG